MIRFGKKKSSKVLLVTSIVTIIFWLMGPKSTDILYASGLFQVLRVIYDHSIGLLPIPFIYISLLFVLFRTFYCFFQKSGWKKKILDFLELIAWLLCLFYFLWGINYGTLPVEKKYELEIENPSKEQLILRLQQTTASLNLSSQTLGDRSVPNFQELEKDIRPLLEQKLEQFGYKTWGRVRVRKLIPGSLLLLRTSGIYIPHALEGHVDGGLYPMQWPFTLAHEMSHGYGITAESDCNFFALLACLDSQDPLLRYSAKLAYWRYLSRQVSSFDPEVYRQIRSTLDIEVENDLKKIREHVQKYPDLMPKYRNIIYDQYLKSHGVVEGIKSYDRMILLVDAWERKTGKIIE